MSDRVYVLLAGLVAIVLGASPVAQSFEGLLRKSDVGGFVPGAFRARLSMRQQGGNSRSDVELWRSGSDRTLVRMLDTSERGKYLLRLRADLWFLTPTAKKPVHLSPTHRIYGAATLDVLLGMRLSDDYRIVSATPEASRGTVTFELAAKSEALQFATIQYVVQAAIERPSSALYRLASGREATRVEFSDWMGGTKSPRYARRILVRDMLRKGALTTIEVTECEERAIPDALFDLSNPAARQALEKSGR